MTEHCARNSSVENGVCTNMEGNKVCGAFVVESEVFQGTCLEEAPETPVTLFPGNEL
jgi:hypothetical protein